MAKLEQSSVFLSPMGDISGEFRPECEFLYSSDGGYSELYRYNKDGKFRVLKALKPKYRGDFLYERLLRKEYEIGYELDHINICKIFSWLYTEELGNCIEMEYIDGVTLQEEIEGGTLDKGDVRKIILEICDALTYIHHKQIIHRDLKPQNIIITHNGKNVKLIDFGLSDTDWHSILKGKGGTIEYAAPELIEEGEVDCRCDIWSLGVIINHLGERYRKIARKCMNKEKQKRFSSAEEVKKSILQSDTRKYWWIIPAGIAAIAAIIIGIGAIEQSKATKTIDTIFEEIGEMIIRTQN